MNAQKQKEIADMVKTLLDTNEIGKEDVGAVKVCLACLFYGANKTQVKENVRVRKFEFYWNNLAKNGYLNDDGSINVDKSFFKNDISFLMMVLAAKGFVRTRFEEDEILEAKR